TRRYGYAHQVPSRFGLMRKSVKLAGTYSGEPMFSKFVMNALLLCVLPAALSYAQQLSPKWEELTAEDFVKALQASSGVCLLPSGIIEKHGPSGPLGTDLINVRGATLEAVKQQ